MRAKGSMDYKDFGYSSAGGGFTVGYLRGPIFDLVGDVPAGARVLDVGCGNGFWAGQFIERGCKVVGVDLSEEGIAIARKAHPKGRFEIMSADAQLLERLGEAPFDIVLSLEVVEHL